MKKKDGFVLREVCGEKVIIGEGIDAVDFGKLISMNETAAWLWEQTDSEIDAEKLTKALVGEYDVEEAVAAHDVRAILEEWRRIGIVED